MHKPGSVIGWKLDRDQRGELLQQFPPRYAKAVADHVTLEINAGFKQLPGAVTAAILGRADDGEGVEAMVVAVDGTTDRPDDSTYHITWSLADGRRAVESNDVIRDCGWETFGQAISVNLVPACF